MVDAIAAGVDADDRRGGRNPVRPDDELRALEALDVDSVPEKDGFAHAYASSAPLRVRRLRGRLVFPFLPVDDDLVIRAALLEPYTRTKGRAFGDRLCLALTARLGVPVLTADRDWAELADKVKAEVRLIR